MRGDAQDCSLSDSQISHSPAIPHRLVRRRSCPGPTAGRAGTSTLKPRKRPAQIGNFGEFSGMPSSPNQPRRRRALTFSCQRTIKCYGPGVREFSTPGSFVKTVARCYDAGLSLAALARLGVAVEKSNARRQSVARARLLAIIVRGLLQRFYPLGKERKDPPHRDRPARTVLSTPTPRRASAASESPAQ